MPNPGRSAPEGARAAWARRGTWATGGAASTLALVLLAVTLLPGQEALHKKAEALMASTRYADWVTARDEYLEPLDRRFPDNPFREKTTGWRDRILLADAERRAEYLTAPVKTRFSDPVNHAEGFFVLAHTLATDASSHGNDQRALEHWNEMAAKLNHDDPEERKWYLMARHRAAQLERTIADRRKRVEEQIRMADELRRGGRPEAAAKFDDKVRAQYKDYADVKDLLEALPPPPAPPDRPAPEKPASGSGTAPSPPADRPANPSGPADTPRPPAPGSAAEPPPAAATAGDRTARGFIGSSPTI